MKRYIYSTIKVGPVPTILQIDRFRKDIETQETTQADVRKLVRELDSLRDIEDFSNPVVGITQRGSIVTATFKNNRTISLDANKLDPDWFSTVCKLVEGK